MDGQRAAMQRIETTRVIVVVRGSKTTGVVALASALAEVGLDIFEVTMNTPGAVDCIEAIRAKHPGIFVGAGTVLDASLARTAIAAGAQFVVSPTLDCEVIALAKDQGVVSIPGTFTPTEAYQAWTAGASAVKIFPAFVGGPKYIRALLAPMPELRLVPTGGVTAQDAASYLEAGALAVCLGSSFLDREALARGVYDRALRDAEGLVSRVRALKRAGRRLQPVGGDDSCA
jgi:2-dehydro-3-deoxyphosphogluconate aldolase/(4S)-4-hydroxy-2-oxoglutarate aldolase